MSKKSELDIQEARIIKMTEEFNANKEELAKIGTLERKRKEVDELISKFEKDKADFENKSKADREEINKMKSETKSLFDQAKQDSDKAQNVLESLQLEKDKFAEEKSKLIQENSKEIERIKKMRSDLAAEERRISEISSGYEKRCNSLQAQEARINSLIAQQQTLKSDTEKQIEISRKAIENDKAELNDMIAKNSALVNENKMVLSEIASDKEQAILEREATQRMLTDISNTKEEVKLKEKRCADLLNRNSEVEIELREREESLKIKERKLNSQIDEKIKRLEQLRAK